MKTIISLTIFVSAHGITYRLTNKDIDKLNHISATRTVMDNYKNGGSIKNNDAADMILKVLGK